MTKLTLRTPTEQPTSLMPLLWRTAALGRVPNGHWLRDKARALYATLEGAVVANLEKLLEPWASAAHTAMLLHPPMPASHVGTPALPLHLFPTVYMGHLDEASLAQLQQQQPPFGNDSGEFSTAAALNYLYGGHNVRGEDVAFISEGLAKRQKWSGRRLGENGPTTPQQQVNFINHIAQQGSLALTAQAGKGTRADLLHLLTQANTAVLVTIGWSPNQRPVLRRSTEEALLATPPPPNSHSQALLVAAYDAAHTLRDGTVAPWGFVNSWVEGGQEIYWMPETDFTQAWSYPFSSGEGTHNMVVVTRSDAILGSLPSPMP